MAAPTPLASSFRDPSGYVFRLDGVLLRRINLPYEADWRALKETGLYQELLENRLLVRAEELPASEGVALLKPQELPFISYPYEWCFGQLKDAAMLTLEIAERAQARGMSLKDASAYNVQFLEGKPILIDSLSFEIYREGEPWIAYGQFCRHFLAPLALMALVDVRLGSLLRNNIDGIPLDLATRLLPGRTRFSPGLLAHVHMHGKAQTRPAEETKRAVRVSKTGLLALIDNLKGTIQGLKWEPKGTEWGDYYQATNYSESAMSEKRRLVSAFLSSVNPKPVSCWDLGANTGEFTRLAAEQGIETVAWDIDPAAVQKAYEAKVAHLLPLLQDLTNPTPSIGWALRERESLVERGPADVVMALALIHHLAFGNNVPLPMIAEFFASIGRWAIVEFVPKADSQVRRMLANRRDVFVDYTEEGFAKAFAGPFEIIRQEAISGSERTLFLFRRRGA